MTIKPDLMYVGSAIGINNIPAVIEMNTYWSHAKLLHDWTVEWKRSNRETRLITVRANRFITDGASSPWFARAYAPKFGQALPAAIVHDYLYETQLFKREDADKCFYDLMIKLKVPSTKAWVMFKSVRLGGWWHWKG